MNEETAENEGLSGNWAVREVDHLFHRVARYTRFVVFSKWFLGLFGATLLVVLVIYPLASKDQSGMRMSFVGTEADGTSKPAGAAPLMNNPIYEGTNADGRQFKITGSKATQMGEGVILVDQAEGQLLTGSGFVSLTADQAEYSEALHSIELIGNVNVLNAQGYHFVTPRATIDTETMEVTGKEQISGVGPTGNLLATGFEIRDNGNIVRFGGTGRVNVMIEKSKSP